MLAEIHNKIAQNGSNLTDRLEDKLTGDFFGAIRYLPFELGMKHVLSSVTFLEEGLYQEWQDFISSEKGFMKDMKFWYRHLEGEIDLLVSFTDIVLGIEIKYLSGISSEDEITEVQIDYDTSCNQLARYSRMLNDIAGSKTPFLLFLAPFEIMQNVRKSLEGRTIIDPNVRLGFLCWEDISNTLRDNKVGSLDSGQELIFEDLKCLLEKKGLIRFNGFSTSILNNNISRDSYVFQKDLKTVSRLNWPSKQITEGDFYVFSNH